MSAHSGLLQFASANWFWILIWCWILGVFGAVGEYSRKLARRRRKNAELRHRRRLEIEIARSGGYRLGKHGKLTRCEVLQDDGAGTALPAAVVPSPPSARPVYAAPGDCRHEKIIPVIAVDGTLVRWVCANVTRCDAVFPPSTAIYEPEGSS